MFCEARNFCNVYRNSVAQRFVVFAQGVKIVSVFEPILLRQFVSGVDSDVTPNYRCGFHGRLNSLLLTLPGFIGRDR